MIENKNDNIRIIENNDNYSHIEGNSWVLINNEQDCYKTLQKSIGNNTIIKDYSISIISVRKETKTHNSINNNFIYFIDLPFNDKSIKPDYYQSLSNQYHSLNIFEQLMEENNNLISYKDSKLTKLLNNIKTISCIIIVNPEDVNNTLSCFSFVEKINFYYNILKNNRPKMINDTKIKSMKEYCLLKLQNDLDALNDSYSRLKINYQKEKEKNKELEVKIIELQKKCVSGNSDNINYKNKEIEKIEEIYDNLLANKEKEHEIIVDQMDNLIIEKNEKIDELNRIINRLTEENFRTNLILKDYKIENDEFMKRIIDLTDCPKINIKQNSNNNITYTNQEIQTDSEIIDPQVQELLKTVGRRGKSLTESLNFKDKDIFYKLEYFILRFEKEIYRLKKENKELKEKLYSRKEEISKTNDENLNLSFNSSNNTNKNLAIVKIYSNSFINLSDSDYQLSTEKYNFDFIADKSKNIGLNPCTSSNLDLKILELNNEILQYKTTLKKKNKKLEEYKKLVCKYVNIEKDLVNSKKDLVLINESIHNSKISVKGGSAISESESEIQKSEFEKLQIMYKQNQTDLEIARLIEEKLKNKLNELNAQMIEKNKEITRLKEIIKS